MQSWPNRLERALSITPITARGWNAGKDSMSLWVQSLSLTKAGVGKYTISNVNARNELESL